MMESPARRVKMQIFESVWGVGGVRRERGLGWVQWRSHCQEQKWWRVRACWVDSMEQPAGEFLLSSRCVTKLAI